MVTDESFTSEDEMAQIEKGLTGPRMWCGVFAGQLAKIELTVKTHPDLGRELRDRMSIRMREMVRELAVEAGAREPAQPLVGADGTGGEEAYSEDLTGPDGVAGVQDSTYVPDGEPVPADPEQDEASEAEAAQEEQA